MKLLQIKNTFNVFEMFNINMKGTNKYNKT